jgi:aspartyl aminopeptidase
VFDNEEIGSSSRQGAGSSLLGDILSRVDEAIAATDIDAQGLYRRFANSCILSADNAHAQHPNHPEYADAQNAPHMNGGIVIKHQSEQRYATDAISGAIFNTVCQRANVPTQTYLNRSDIRGGSTLGNIVVSQIPMLTLDIGLAQLAMHSAYETAGAQDVIHMIKAAGAFYHTAIQTNKNGQYNIDITL